MKGSHDARDGDVSHDPAFDPGRPFKGAGRTENVERVSAAMRTFLAQGNMARFEDAIAVFVRSASARGDPVERVLAVLIELAEEREGVALPHDRAPTDLRKAVLRGVLCAFYGDAAATARTPDSERRHSGERRRSGERAQSDE